MTIPLVFFSLTGLILWFIIGARGHWGIKAFIISADATCMSICREFYSKLCRVAL